MANNFLPFCPVDTGTNLESQADYAAASDRTSGNQPGVAKSALVNKALRQGTYVSGQFAQFLADVTGTDLLDDATPAKLLSQIKAALAFYPPEYTLYGSGTGTHNPTYLFQIASGSATIGATYTNNSITFTVKATVASGVLIKMTGSGAPLVSGTLTKASGTGDATLTFYSYRAPQVMNVEMVGGGGGGASTGGGGASGDAGGSTTFGTSLLSCTGGGGGATNGNGGSAGAATITAPAVGLAVSGGVGDCSGANTAQGAGGAGAAGPYGGVGGGGFSTVRNGVSATTNSGAGGGGGGGTVGSGGGGGGSGAYISASIYSPSGSYPWAVGAKGSGKTGTTSSGDGGSGVIQVFENYQ